MHEALIPPSPAFNVPAYGIRNEILATPVVKAVLSSEHAIRNDCSKSTNEEGVLYATPRAVVLSAVNTWLLLPTGTRACVVL